MHQTTRPDILPGFSRPVADSQSVFRTLLQAMANPVRILEIPVPISAPPDFSPAAAACLLAMADMDTPVWIDLDPDDAIASHLRFHCGAPVLHDPEQAAFALIRDPAAMPELERFPLGSAEYPDRSATLIIQVDGLENRGGRTLQGPGIESSMELSARGLPDSFWSSREALGEIYPRGIDAFLVAGCRVAGLPRTTRILEK